MVLDPGRGSVERAAGRGTPRSERPEIATREVPRNGLRTPHSRPQSSSTFSRSKAALSSRGIVSPEAEVTRSMGLDVQNLTLSEVKRSVGLEVKRSTKPASRKTPESEVKKPPGSEVKKPSSSAVKRFSGSEVKRSSGRSPGPPSRSLTSPVFNGRGGWMRRSESTCAMNGVAGGERGGMRPATSLPHIARGSQPGASSGGGGKTCLLVALRPTNIDQEREAFFRAGFNYEPQFEYGEQQATNVLEKYREGSSQFLTQAVRIMHCVLRKYGSYESFEVATGGNVLPKCQVWASVRKYLQKEGCVGEVVVRLSEELLSQAVMMVKSCRPTLTINLAGARQHWLEGMLRHEIGTHYIRGVNNNRQPWSNAAGRKQFGLKPANPTEEGLASLHSVLFRRNPFLWRAALLYYTVYHAGHMSFSQLFSDIGQFVQDPAVRWEYCVRAKRGQTDTSRPGCFSKDQVYLDGILRILRHRRNIDFKMLACLGKVSYEDVEHLRKFAVLAQTRIPHFMKDQQRYLEQLDHIVSANELNDEELCQLIPE
ncbi:microtubule-associated tyrosine carboxypeptidase [Acipenser ruthenus]|uniref:microtubule-associated tyrosine carboxypeptidase n=1 Tax=Acipenser ruthenus TaxID=7906 RepID=UPI00145B637D|nr:microtubule-associated tyrosine carboxypeptidase [Acipenser ruthenus]